MLRSKILRGVFLAVAALAILPARSGFSEPAADACRAHPGLETPRGAHWYYRINRADKRHCWYLGSAAAAAARAAAPREAASASTVARASAAETREARASAEPAPATSGVLAAATTAPTPVVFLDGTLAAEKARADFAARWPNDLPDPQDLTAAEPKTASDSYAERRADEDRSEAMPSWPVAAAAPTPQASAGDIALHYFTLAGGFAIAFLLLIGWSARFTHQPYRSHLHGRWRAMSAKLHGDIARAGDIAHMRDRCRAMVSRLSRDSSRMHDRWHLMMAGLYRGASAVAADGRRAAPRRRSNRRSRPTPTDPAVDLKRSLAELMRDLRRTEAALDSEKNLERPFHRRQCVLQAAE